MIIIIILYTSNWFCIQVRLVDTGEECIVDVNQLYTLPLSFLETPPLVIEAFLCGLIPPDNDTDWPPPVSHVIMYSMTIKLS